ncbi:NADP-dependent 3-hydroxy acid dehydrogenase YdfG [Thermosporothrix hazakensis]|jgi:NAD(P)-dependent dehydrogenase (short-subunit alcohol dehydrogenase family)|uniref:NADP-dependent 3-hydroxy acid dehydrogenase YdfG n=1 Tax=Thermosporothrix hazakensis TaxID=644383 RepID=A0A326U7L9_THEHA|nr:SDR family oxidoreductase [Thermosporothrix hazakensis]PZW27072.1 NADP-dependent 3-hydroxy acid dehydrogenase YdfG [Thermosporothrix hazakensis]GCE50357.1 dehydrogenase [Thermosporothrix hazakensis]
MSSQSKKIALVTGANQGIGLEIARQLGEQGITVLIGARNTARGEEAARGLNADGLLASALYLDVTAQQSIENAARWLSETYGRLDILVNNAAIAPSTWRPASDVPLEEVRALYETNVFGLLAVTQAMLPLLRRSSAGRIVNISSGMASLSRMSQVPPEILQAFPVSLASSKTTVNALTLFLAKELERTGIKVNAVDPGPTATARNPRGSRTPQQAARVAVHFATIADDGPTGGFFDENGSLPW